MKNPRVIFAGTPDFALASLSALVDAGVVPVAVLTQPDRPAGRGKRLTASPVKRFSLKHDIAVMQPPTLRDDEAVAALEALLPDLMIVAAYGLILPQRVLDVAARGSVNVHASLLPRWRGAAPVQAAILAGDTTSGVSLMSMTAGLDCGPVFVAESLRLAADETAGSLLERLARLGGRLLVQNLDGLLEQGITPTPQDEAAATYAGKISKADAQLDWTLSAEVLERQVRAYNPAPGAFFFAPAGRGGAASAALRIKCWRAQALADIDARPGSVVASHAYGVDVACGSGGLRLLELQLPGKRRVNVREFSKQLDLSGRELGQA